MKHKSLRCAAETAALLLTVAMLTFLIAGLHQHEPDRELSTLDTGWYQLTDSVRHEVAPRSRFRPRRNRRLPCITTR